MIEESRKKIDEKIISIIKDYTVEGYNIDITKESILIDDLSFNSFTLIKLFIKLEEEFKFEFDDQEYENISTYKVKTVIELIENKIFDLKKYETI